MSGRVKLFAGTRARAAHARTARRPSETIVRMASQLASFVRRRAALVAPLFVVALSAPGCAVVSVAGTAVSVAGSAAGAAVSVGGAVVGSTVKVAGKVVEKTVDLAVPGGSPAAAK
jgi:hypothetical protein